MWKTVKVRKTEGKRLRGNTKEIERRVNIWKVFEDELSYQYESTLQKEDI